jgi:hypothetical protein
MMAAGGLMSYYKIRGTVSAMNGRGTVAQGLKALQYVRRAVRAARVLRMFSNHYSRQMLFSAIQQKP